MQNQFKKCFRARFSQSEDVQALSDGTQMNTYSENGCERHVVVDAALGPSSQSQADKPHAGNPELVVRRGQVLQVPQLL